MIVWSCSHLPCTPSQMDAEERSAVDDIHPLHGGEVESMENEMDAEVCI